MKDLTIKLKLDRSQAKAEAVEHISDAKKMESATAQQHAAEKQGLNEVAAAARTASRDEKGRYQAIGATTRATGDLGKTTAATGDAIKQFGHSGSISIGKLSLSIASMQTGMMQALQIASTLSQAMQDVAKRYRELTGDFTGQRDKLGELAGVLGKPADNKFTTENQQFNKGVGFKPEEGLQFRLGINNAGMQYRGSKISDTEYDQFEKQAGQIAVARGIDPGVVGDLAGTLLGAKDRRGMGDKASEEAAGKLNSGLAILGAGKGDNSVLARQFSMLSSASLNEDAMKGIFQDSDETATVVSLYAQKHDAQASEMAQAAGRGLRDFKGDAGPLLAKAGVTPQTSWIDSMKLLTPHVLQEARDSGGKVEDVLKTYFPDQTTREGIAIGINQGVVGGAFENRAKVAKDNGGPGPAMDLIENSRKTERVVQRVADADVIAAEGETGAKNTRLAILRQEAIANLTRSGDIGSTGAAISDGFQKILTLGASDPKEDRITNEQARIVSRRAEAAGVKVSPRDLIGGSSWSDEERSARMNNAMDATTAAGGDPLKDLAGALQANTVAVQQNNVLMNRQAVPTPATPPATPPPTRQAGVPGRPS